MGLIWENRKERGGRAQTDRQTLTHLTGEKEKDERRTKRGSEDQHMTYELQNKTGNNSNKNSNHDTDESS